MTDRFLRYSVLHNKKIRAVYLKEGQIKQENILVLSYDDDAVHYLTSKRKTPQTLPLGSLLGCDYARGDAGDTLENAQKEGT